MKENQKQVKNKEKEKTQTRQGRKWEEQIGLPILG
jgi:hypothetical protein